MQNQLFILRSVFNVKFTKYRTCAQWKSGEEEQESQGMEGVVYHIGAGTLYARGIFREKISCQKSDVVFCLTEFEKFGGSRDKTNGFKKTLTCPLALQLIR